MQIALKPLALALSVAWTSSALASPEGVESQLLEQSRQWEEQLRDDLARQPLNKVLRTRPTQPEALARLGEIEIRARNHPRAEKLLAQLKATAPDSPSTRQLDLALRLATTDAEKVNQARALTRTGKPASDSRISRRRRCGVEGKASRISCAWCLEIRRGNLVGARTLRPQTMLPHN